MSIRPLTMSTAVCKKLHLTKFVVLTHSEVFWCSVGIPASLNTAALKLLRTFWVKYVATTFFLRYLCS